MVMLKLPMDPLPDLPERVTPSYAVNTSQYGDGYRSEAPAGINSRTDTRTMSWTNITNEEFNAIYDFLEAHAPSKPFLYEQVGTGVQMPYTCKEFDYAQGNGGLYNINAKFVQIHGIV